MINRFLPVTKGLFRGSAPTYLDVITLKTKYGINKIVSLDQQSGDKIKDAAEKLGIKQIIIPLTFNSAGLLKLLDYDLKDLLINDGPTFVHCYHGKDRTGLVCALFECKYLNEDPERAIENAKELGMGLGLNPKVTRFYEKIIRSCKSNKDINDADIVSISREPIGDNRDSYLDQAQQGSFAPYLSKTRQMPMDSVYNPINDQSPTRENYQNYKEVPDLKTMSFPKEEYLLLKERVDNNKPIFTTRVSSEMGLWNRDEVVKSPFGLLKIIDIEKLGDLSEHPFLNELTFNQKAELQSYDKMELIKLIPLNVPYEEVINSENVVPQVGLFNNDAGGQFTGPTINMTGFIYE